YVLAGEELFPSVKSDGVSVPRAAGEPGGGAADAAEGETLYSPVNSNEEAAEAAPGEGDALYFSVNSDAEAPSLPREAGEGGSPERSEGEPGGGLSHPLDLEMPDRSESDRLYFSVDSEHVSAGASPPPGAADAAPPSPCGGGMHINP